MHLNPTELPPIAHGEVPSFTYWDAYYNDCYYRNDISKSVEYLITTMKQLYASGKKSVRLSEIAGELFFGAVADQYASYSIMAWASRELLKDNLLLVSAPIIEPDHSGHKLTISDYALGVLGIPQQKTEGDESK